MANRWIEFVRMWSRKHNISYACAVSKPECKEEYRTKYGNRKRLTQKKERELMGMEDVNVALKKKPAKKKSAKKKKIIIEDSGEPQNLTPFNEKLFKELLSKVENKKQLLELSRMMGEDYNVLPKPKPKLSLKETTKKVENIKKRSSPRIKEKESGVVERSNDSDVIKPGWLSKALEKLSVNDLNKIIYYFYKDYNIKKGRYNTKNFLIVRLIGKPVKEVESAIEKVDELPEAPLFTGKKARQPKQFDVEVGDVLRRNWGSGEFLERVISIRPQSYTVEFKDGEKLARYSDEGIIENLGKIKF